MSDFEFELFVIDMMFDNLKWEFLGLLPEETLKKNSRPKDWRKYHII